MREDSWPPLEWRSIDVDAGIVQVVPGRVPLALDPERRDHIGDPKSRVSRRVVHVEALHSGAMKLLREYQVRTGRRSGLAAIDGAGLPLRPQWFSDRFQALCREAGVPVIRLHAIRHSIADELAARPDVSDIDAAALVGHDVRTFHAVYARSREEGQRNAATRPGEVFATGS